MSVADVIVRPAASADLPAIGKLGAWLPTDYDRDDTRSIQACESGKGPEIAYRIERYGK